MSSNSRKHLSDQALGRALAADCTQDRTTTTSMLANIAEFDARKLYLPAAYPSMFLYCVHELRMSEDIAFKRIRVARLARRFPEIYEPLAEGRLNISGLVLLAPHLRTRAMAGLITATMDKSRADIQRLIAERFPQSDVPTRVELLAPAVNGPVQLAPGPVSLSSTELSLEAANVSMLQSVSDAKATAQAPAYPKLAPRSPGRFSLQVTVDQDTHDQLRYAQALLGHAVPSSDVAAVLKRALNALVEKLERQKFAKCARSRPRRGAPKGRYVPAEVRRSVWQRDDGRCTFMSDGGKRCDARERLEFDHADPIAKGGQATTSNLRLRCRAHNQYAADCTFGAGFMHEKRQAARRKAACIATRTPSEAAPKPATDPEVIPWLRQLGFNATEANRGAALCESMAAAPLEQRIRVALQGLAPNCLRGPAPSTGSSA